MRSKNLGTRDFSEMSHQIPPPKISNPTSSTRPRPSARKRKVTPNNDSGDEFDVEIKIERPESPVFCILPDDDPLNTDTPCTEGSKRRKQTFNSTMYTTPIFIPSPIQPENATTTAPISKNTSTKSAITTTLTSPKSSYKPSYKELEQLLVKSQNELITLKLEKQTMEKDLRVHINENIDLERSLSTTNKELNDATQKVSVLEREKSNLVGVLKEFENLKSYTERIEGQLKEKSKLTASCETVCKKFDLKTVKSFDSYLLHSYFGFYDYSSIQSLIDLLEEYSSGKHYRNTKLSLGHKVLMLLLKIRLDIPSRALMHFFCISKATYSYIYNHFMDIVYELFYEGDSRIIKIPNKQESFSSSNMLSSSSSLCSSSSSTNTATTSFSSTCSVDVSNNNNNNNRRFVIDFIEFEMESRKNSVNCTTTETFVVKLLIGCTLEGKLVFVSHLYDEELESNKSIIIKSKFLDQLESGDELICETDFKLQDVLPKGVSIYIPSRKDEIGMKNMFTQAKQVIRDVVLKIRPLKVLNILPNKEPDKIVRVCLGLTTFIQKTMGKVQSE